MTEIGTALPDSWRTVPVGEICSLQGGFAFKSNEFRPSGIPIVRISNVKERGLDWRSEVFWSEDIEPRIAKFLLQEKDVLISMTGNVGETCMVRSSDLPALLNQRVGRFKIPDPTILDDEFLFFISKTQTFRQAVSGGAYGAVQQNVSGKGIESALIPLPPLPEQKKIAHILSIVQRAIEAQERIIQTTTELKKALMHKLFTEGLRNEAGRPHRQKQTEIGPVPESWEVVELGEVATIERGKFSHRPRNEPRFYGGKYPFVQTGDVSNCDGYVRSYTQTLNEDGLAISKMFPAGTILITIAANIGFTGILEFDSACPDSLIGISPNEDVQTEFLNYYLITQQPEMDRLAPKGTQKNINIQFLKPWRVPLPSVEEQAEIADAFSATDQKIRLATQKRTQLQNLFRTLLHELMTAKIRVNQIELDKSGAIA